MSSILPIQHISGGFYPVKNCSVCLSSFLCAVLALCLFFPALASAEESVKDDDIKYIEGVVLKGENAESILTQYMTMEEFHRLFRSTRKIYDLSRIRQDYSYGLVTSKKTGLKIFEYQIDRSKKVVVEAKDGKYTAAIHPVSYESYPRAVYEAQQEDEPPAVKAVPTLPEKEAEDGKTAEAEDDEQRFDSVVHKGEHAQGIFARCMSPAEFFTLSQAVKKTYNLAVLRQGQPYTLIYGEKSGFHAFEYQINKERKLVVTRTPKGYDAKIHTVKFDVKLCVVQGKITSSLFNSLADVGEKPDIATTIADILGSEINFIRDIRSGDTYQIAIEKYYHGEQFQRYGRIIGLRFKNRGTLYEGFRFSTDGVERYYNAKGESLHKTLLKAPLSFTRVSSRYSHGRRHPIFRDVRAHLGVDYAAPSGTPVKTVGDGVVTKAGWGTGFGRMVVIRHSNGMESMYSHLSRYAKKIRAGVRVRQGQVIGYVGATGWATGPHLDFRIRKNGKFVNPEKVSSNRSEPIRKKEKKRFNEQRTFVQNVLDGKFSLEKYKSGMLYLSAD